MVRARSLRVGFGERLLLLITEFPIRGPTPRRAVGPGKEMRIRCVVRPDRVQAALLDRLGLRLPERLRIPPPGR